MGIARIAVLALAGVAAVFVALYVRNSSQEAPVQTAEAAEPVRDVVRVLVAREDLEIGRFITPNDVRWREWPADGLTEEYFSEDNAPKAVEDNTGAVVRVPLAAGEPLTARKLVDPGDAGFMAAILEPGTRAAAVEISADSAAGGFILPGDRVDVILVREAEGGRRSMQTAQTILENVRVLAIDQTVQRDTEGDEAGLLGSTALLEVYPEEAETIALARNLGDVSLSLRGVMDIRADAAAIAARSRGGLGLGGGMTIYRAGKSERVITGGGG
jgi:pilus assembly protein CpaB